MSRSQNRSVQNAKRANKSKNSKPTNKNQKVDVNEVNKFGDKGNGHIDPKDEAVESRQTPNLSKDFESPYHKLFD